MCACTCEKDVTYHWYVVTVRLGLAGEEDFVVSYTAHERNAIQTARAHRPIYHGVRVRKLEVNGLRNQAFIDRCEADMERLADWTSDFEVTEQAVKVDPKFLNSGITGLRKAVSDFLTVIAEEDPVVVAAMTDDEILDHATQWMNGITW